MNQNSMKRKKQKKNPHKCYQQQANAHLHKTIEVTIFVEYNTKTIKPTIFGLWIGTKGALHNATIKMTCKMLGA